ncbi:MAG TPA: alkaline phosphatase family protein, partial [Chitinophagaceae bacterium]|nr:alkaline phosphatase family protein [Chitinophagaceae bacterium]
MNRIFLSVFFIISFNYMFGQTAKAENVIIITLDGFRWQEVFGGADDSLINDPKFSFDTASLKKKFWASTPCERRRKLLPFFWDSIATQGQLHGNRNFGSKVNVKNRYWFSYPGYNEIFTGYPDTAVNSNDKIFNKNTTVLEFLNDQPQYKGKVAAFSSWDCFDAIFNAPRAKFFVSAGVDTLPFNTASFDLLNEMQETSPLPMGDDVRPDHLTYFIAKEYLKEYKPKILYIAFDETDDYAHAGRYDQYLNMAHREDMWIGDLWNTVQHMKEYKNKTTLLILCDHGRGDKVKKEWRSHGEKIEGSDQIWLAALGAGIESKGEIKK